jgi:hypothetical protein
MGKRCGGDVTIQSQPRHAPVVFGLRPASELRQAVSCSTTIRNTSASASNDARKDLFMGKTFFPKNDSAPQLSSLRGFF